MATITSTQSGLWSATSTWVGGVVPVNDDSVVIAVGHQVEFDVDQSAFTNGIKSITIQNTAKLFCTRTQNSSLSISSITRSGTTATVTCNSHGLSSSDVVLITGSTIYGYNGKWTITYVDANTFTFTCSSDLTSPATGTISCRKVKTVYLKMGSSVDTETVDITSTATSGHLGTFEADLSDRRDIEFIINFTGTATVKQSRRFFGTTYKSLLVNIKCYDKTPRYIRSNALVASGNIINFDSIDLSDWNVGDSVFMADPVVGKNGRGAWNGQGTYSLEEVIISEKTDTKLGFSTNFVNGLNTGKNIGTFLANITRNIRLINCGGGTPSGSVDVAIFDSLANNSVINMECKSHNYTTINGSYINNVANSTISGVFSTWVGQNPRTGNNFGIRNNVYGITFNNYVCLFGGNNLYYYSNMVGNIITNSIFMGTGSIVSGCQNSYVNCVFTCGTITSGFYGATNFDECLFSGNPRFGISIGTGNPTFYLTADGIIMNLCSFEYMQYAFGQGALSAKLYNCTFNNNTRDISQNVGRIELYSCTLNSSTQWERWSPVSNTVDNLYALTQAYDLNGVNGSFKAWSLGGIIATDTSTYLDSTPANKWTLASADNYCISEKFLTCAPNIELLIELYMQQSVTGMTSPLKCDIFLPHQDPWLNPNGVTLASWQISENTNKQKKVYSYKSSSAQTVGVRLYAKNASGYIWTTLLSSMRIRKDIINSGAYVRPT